MVRYIGALATDFDGTLTHDGLRPAANVLDALRRVRDSGCLVLLVTGRIIDELQADFPDVHDHVDAIVAENGCVLSTPMGHRLLAPPVGDHLATVLSDRGVSVRRGEVILAGGADDRVAALEEIHRFELDCQLVFNRSEMMILPSGLNKGTGLYEALGDMGVSRHSTIGVGDAENDRALLDVCEVGVAVSNAVESLKEFADIVLTAPAGEGVLELTDGILRTDTPVVHSERWRLRLGTTLEGAAASVPSSQMKVLICGRPGTGKSHLVGLIAERLIAQGYCVLVVDPEGDHQGLGRLRGVVVIDGKDGLPRPERVAATFSQRYTSVVLDLSQVKEHERHPYLEGLAAAVERSRAICGLPHWIIDDEAHNTVPLLGPDSVAVAGNTYMGPWGSCLATFRPDLLDSGARDRMDAVVFTGVGIPPGGDTVGLLARVSGHPRDEVALELSSLRRGEAYLAVRPDVGPSTAFNVASRVTEHRRHRHKYVDGALPPERRFYFRDCQDALVSVAANMCDLQSVLSQCPADVIEHHATGHDFSRWIDEVFSDAYLAGQVVELEDRLAAGQLAVEDARNLITGAVNHSYGLGPDYQARGRPILTV